MSSLIAGRLVLLAALVAAVAGGVPWEFAVPIWFVGVFLFSYWWYGQVGGADRDAG
jgi:hypothetical protein